MRFQRSSPLTREQLLELITRLSDCDGTEQEQDDWLRLVSANVPHPAISDLIFRYHRLALPDPARLEAELARTRRLLEGRPQDDSADIP
jgi:hypothetical protein